MSPPTLDSVATAPVIIRKGETGFRQAVGRFYHEGKLDLSIGLIVAGAALLYGLGVQYMHDSSIIARIHKERTEYRQPR